MAFFNDSEIADQIINREEAKKRILERRLEQLQKNENTCQASVILV